MISRLKLSAGGGICLFLALKRAFFIVNYSDCYLDLSLHHMLKMSSLSSNTGTKTLAPLLDCFIDNCLIKLCPLLNETSLQMVHVMNPHTIHSFLKDSPDFVIDGVEVGTVGWPQCWWDESGRLSLEHCYGVIGSVRRCTTQLEDEEMPDWSLMAGRRFWDRSWLR